MSWILKWILLYPCDEEIYSSVYLALRFVVMQLFCYFYVSTWIKEKYHLFSVYLGRCELRIPTHIHAHDIKPDKLAALHIPTSLTHMKSEY